MTVYATTPKWPKEVVAEKLSELGKGITVKLEDYIDSRIVELLLQTQFAVAES